MSSTPPTPRIGLLSIGVGSFTDDSEWEDLSFVRERVKKLTDTFSGFGAEVTSEIDLDDGQIESLLRDKIVAPTEPFDVLVVHLIGHGELKYDRLSFIARNGRRVDVNSWINRAQDEADHAPAEQRQRVVFLVDTCEAGAATGRQAIVELDPAQRGVWPLGAVVSGTPTERGRFSEAIATALLKLATTDFALEVGPVDFSRFVAEVQLALPMGERSRISLGFTLEQGYGEWPFLPNPRTVELSPEQLAELRASFWYIPGQDLGAQVASDADIDDADYFVDRASGRSLINVSGGFFTGRVDQLSTFRKWLADDERPLLVVTGSAGAGKSGLLGVIACAGHPQSRERTRPLWEHADRELPELEGLIAVHARRRSAQQLVELIAKSAGLSFPSANGEEGQSAHWHPAALRLALQLEDRGRLIIIDAVDESADAAAVRDLIDWLTRPLEGSVRPPCRVLAGGRRETFDELKAPEQPEWIDLDAVAPDTVEQDVRQYLVRLLEASEAYGSGRAADFVHVIAETAAARIARPEQGPAHWGPFLLAGMFAHYLVTLPSPPSNQVDAEAHAERAAGELPRILEVVLDTRRDRFPLLRSLLALLARTRGDGMPLTVLRRCLAALHPGDEVTAESCRSMLRELHPYLRTGVDPDSQVALYRLFHQGLADYLCSYPSHKKHRLTAEGEQLLERTALAAMVTPYIGPHSTDGWASAEPYLLRHALDHVLAGDSAEHADLLLADPYFLVRFDLRQDLRALDLARSEQATQYLRLLRASWAAHGLHSDAPDRASLFEFDAQRLNMVEQQAEFRRVAAALASNSEATQCTVRWARGGTMDTSSRHIPVPDSYIEGLAFSPDGSMLAVGIFGGVRLLSTTTWRDVVRPIRNTPWGWVHAVAFSPNGQWLAWGAGGPEHSILLWDVTRQEPWGGLLHHSHTINSIAFAPDSRMLATASDDHTVALWDMDGDRPVVKHRLPHPDVTSVAFCPGAAPLLASVGDGVVALWNTQTGQPEDEHPDMPQSWARSAAFSPDGATLAIADADGYVHLWSVPGRQWTGKLTTEAYQDSGDMAFSPDGTYLAVTDERIIQIWDVNSREAVAHLPGHSNSVEALAFSPVQPLLLASGGHDGAIRLWRETDWSGSAQQPGTGSLEAIACSPDGHHLAILTGAGDLLLCDPATGEIRFSHPMVDNVGRQRTLTFSPSSELLAVSDDRRGLHLIPVNTPDAANWFTVHLAGQRILTQQISPDSKLIAILATSPRTEPDSIVVWDIGAQRQLGRIPLPGRPDFFDFAGPDRLLVSVNGAQAVYTWETP